MMPECELATDLVRCTILMVLYNGPCHGYSIMTILQERLDRAISPAIIYPFLASLSKAGYVTARRQREGRRVKLVYVMTPEGRRFSDRVFERLSEMIPTAVNHSQMICPHCGARLVRRARGRPSN